MKDYTLIILGGGVAGYTAAIRAAKNGMKVTLFERDFLGGTCLNRGCIPTKTLLHSAELFASRELWAQMGVLAENVSLDENAIYARKDAIVGKLREGMISLVQANKIDHIPHEAAFVGENSVIADGETYSAEHILIATGAVPARLKIPGIELTMNAYRVLHKPLPPEWKNVLIIGGGAIGVEFATYFAHTGRSVTILETQDRILPMMEEELSLRLADVLREKGVAIRTSVVVEEFRKEETLLAATSWQPGTERSAVTGYGSGDRFGGAIRSLRCATFPAAMTFPADAIIVCVGMCPNIGRLCLEKAGIRAERDITVDEKMHTGVGGIYAAGDVLGRIQLAHYAIATATVAVDDMLDMRAGRPRSQSIDLNTVPACIYTFPEIAAVGLTEADCAARNIEIEVGKTLMGGNGKSIITGTAPGYIKTVVEKSTGRILGATAFCDRATDILGELSLAISQGITRDEVLRVIHAHPTVMEGIYESLEKKKKSEHEA